MASSTPSVPPIHDPSHPSAAHNSIAQPHNSVPQPQPHYADLDDEQESDAVPTTQPAPPSHLSPEIRLALLGPYMLMVVCTFADLFLSMLAKGLDNVPSTRNINWGKMAIQAVFYLSCVPLAVYSTIKGPRHWLPYLVVILLIGVAVGFTAESQFVIISSAIAIVYGFKHADSSTLSFLPFLQPVLRLLFNIPGRTGAAAPHNQDLEMGMAARPPLQHGQYGNTSITTAPTDPTAAASTGNATASHAPSHESNTNSSAVTTSQQSS